MRKFTGYTAVAAVMLLAGVFVCMSLVRPHRFRESECGLCHISVGDEMVLREPLDYQCRRCHEEIFKKGFLHPVNVVPRKATVPADMPLSRSGRITCCTCHYIHPEHQNSCSNPDSLLRRLETGRMFCATCHAGAAYSRGGHAAAFRQAHFKSEYIVTDPSQHIDPVSKNCISCHDGSYSTSVTLSAGIWSHSTSITGGDMGGNHPIGVDYERARLRHGRRTDLRPISMVDSRIRFFDGTVGCGSCHDPFSSNHRQLVIPNRNSRLCLACHEVDM